MTLDLQAIFEDAHTIQAFDGQAVSLETLTALVERMRWAPTAMNCSPLRVVFVQSAEAKAKLQPCLSPGNVDKTMAAPVTAIAAWDTAFFEHMGTLAPHMPGAQERFAGNPAMAEKTGALSATLQVGYFTLAARGLGLGVGPMAGLTRLPSMPRFSQTGVTVRCSCSTWVTQRPMPRAHAPHA